MGNFIKKFKKFTLFLFLFFCSSAVFPESPQNNSKDSTFFEDVLPLLAQYYASGLTDYVIDSMPEREYQEIRKFGKEIASEIIERSNIEWRKSELLNLFFQELFDDKRVHLFVIKNNEFNAFALFGDFIFVHSRVLDELNSYGELSALLAHEYAHLRKRHGAKNFLRFLSKKFISGSLENKNQSEIKQIISLIAQELMFLKGSREFEYEADKEAVNLLEHWGVSPMKMLTLFKVIYRIEQQERGIALPSFISSHPDTKERFEKLKKQISKINLENIYLDGERLEDTFHALKRLSYE